MAEKDPEFYKYLQENDKELLEFDPNALEVDESPETDEMRDTIPILTKETLMAWQKALLEVSFRISLVVTSFLTALASFYPSVTETSNRIPFRCSHPR